MLMENAFCASKLSLILTETRQTRSLCIRAILSFADFNALDLSNILSSKSFPLKHLCGQRLGKRKKRNGSSFFDLSWVSRVVSFLSRIKEREREFFPVADRARSGRLFATRGAGGRVGRGATRGQRILSSLEEDRKRVHIRLAEAALQTEVRLTLRRCKFRSFINGVRFSFDSSPRRIIDSLLFVPGRRRISWIRGPHGHYRRK